MSDEKKSVASSQSSSAAAALNVIRFNAFDEVLFAMLYTFHKEPRLGQLFYIFEACIIAFQNMAVSFRRLDWPLQKDVLELLNDVFRYVGFSIVWKNETLLIMLTIILGVITLALLVGVVICTMLNKKGSTAVPIFAKIINIGVVMLSGIFYTPCVNVFIGSLQCYTVTSDPASAATIGCGTAMRLLFLIIGLIFLVVLVPFTFLIRLFIFSHNHKKGGIFSLQTGVYFTVLQIVSTILQIIGLLLRTQKLLIAILGTFIYGITILYTLLLQPYFHPLGNTVWSSLNTIVFTCYFIGIPVAVLDTSKVWVTVIVWILFIPAVIGLPILAGWMTYKRGRSLWAVREDEDITGLVNNADTILLQKQSPRNQYSYQQTSQQQPLYQQQNNPITQQGPNIQLQPMQAQYSASTGSTQSAQLHSNEIGQMNNNLQTQSPTAMLNPQGQLIRTDGTESAPVIDKSSSPRNGISVGKPLSLLLHNQNDITTVPDYQSASAPDVKPKAVSFLTSVPNNINQSQVSDRQQTAKLQSGFAQSQKSNVINNTKQTNKKLKQPIVLKKAPKLRKYKSVFAVENAIKFLCKKEMRKKSDAIIIAEQI
ncbi:MAG: hypothetical protein EZS28_036633, partial [Streblomastix strix]